MAPLSPYRQLSPAQRVDLVTRALKTSKDMRTVLVTRMISRGGGYRPQTLLQWPPEKLAREIVRLGAENADDELNLLNMLYVEFAPQIQSAFLDAAGVTHENGQMPEALEPPFAEAARVAAASSTIVERFGDDGRHYLRTIAKYNTAGWPGIEAIVAAFSATAQR